MTTIVLQIILGLVSLGATVFVWWVKNNEDKKKRIADEDEKIDQASSFDDFVRIDDELRGK